MNQGCETIAVNNLFFAYPGGQQLFHNLSFNLDAPAFHALLGRSGVGKSTLAKIICGLEKNWSGKASLPRSVLYCHCRERFPLWQTIRSHLDDVICPSKRNDIKMLMQAFDLDSDLLVQHPGTISSGQHNRFNVLRYLLQDFDLLILDEALNNVDEPTRLKILSEIKSKYPCRTFLYISHHLFDAISFAKTLLILKASNAEVQIVSRCGLNLSQYDPAKATDLASEIWKVINNA
ncbi:MAG: ATP-binding cassette domain-containing protein [Candidatus Contendobacter sp.]|nr:ATP-binding cassette domain-containing protein [Candidatus Contendobacter sp.]MDG4557958.1 ATP-binding cassette domain-containing protein [Candidatus Contendobacter sp.]